AGRLNFGVLFAIGIGMMCMALLRRLPTWSLLAFGVGWLALGEFPTDWAWDPPGSASPAAALLVATYGSDALAIKYPLIPWLSMMVLGWTLGRHMLEFAAGRARVSPQAVLFIAGSLMLAAFVAVRASQGYGDMFLPRTDDTWQQWLHVSKYPPSLAYASLELGLLSLALALLMTIEPYIGVRQNGVFLVFGQTAMFFYIVHRLTFEVPATYFGLRGAGDLVTTYVVAFAMLALLYPACRWYRTFKAAHPQSFLKYL
ncbi:MAG TPA: heparan-alpha-glucosaminide N-acetyltransferase domain-containing protein, partial [Gammaproteobacteria bacterium]|nr:heparan-alpha-glucosaminide N-acetyltransferase domain-containing protein [Gammaproteobacteria bacterium]